MTNSHVPVVALRNVSRRFAKGDIQVRALSDITLDVYSGEFVAILGPSGSGKSTLMNIIGCLDRPSSGDCFYRAKSISEVSANERARLRREVYGFVFQDYNLLPAHTAKENVLIPAIYAGLPKRDSEARATKLLSDIGLANRLDHTPSELSGGEQQRVAIARALMNESEVILADEPTGALDSRSGIQIIEHLKLLVADGRTVIVVTHDPVVASHAERRIELLDGRVIADTGASSKRYKAAENATVYKLGSRNVGDTSAAIVRKMALSISESLRSGVRALTRKKLRTALTLLGIIIGVLSVTAMLGIAEGVRRGILQTLSSLGGANLSIQSIAGPEGRGKPLTIGDADAIRGQIPNLDLVAPQIRSGGPLKVGGRLQHAVIVATTASAMERSGMPLASGSYFSEQHSNDYQPVVVLGATLAGDLFENKEEPIGQYVQLHEELYQVIGVLQPDRSPYSLRAQFAYIPLLTGVVRLTGRSELDSINIVVSDPNQLNKLEEDIRTLVKQRHGALDFHISNQSRVLEAQETTGDILRLLLGSVGGISLLVAGIGIMNIMLASVAERTREIGLRMATGARQRDILIQFVCEAVVVSALGGLIGLLLALGLGTVVNSIGIVEVAFTMPILMIGISSATLTGLLFGLAPARRASQLDPVVALATQ